MRLIAIAISTVFCLSVLALPGCVTSGTHEKVLAELAQTQESLKANQELLEKERKTFEGEKKDRDDKLANAAKKDADQQTMLASMSMNMEQLSEKIQKLTGEKGQLSQEREQMEGRQKELMVQVEELKRMRAAAERRNADFKRLVMKLKKMMDAGTLEVKPRNGLLVVQMSSDVVFAPGATRIKEEAKEALTELAQTLATFEGRRFQVVGHSDNKPIHSARFPSNWELSSARAVVVVKLLVEAGVKPEMINAAGQAEFDPLVDNETPENRTINRRVEIVFLPKIDELPGFDEVLSGK